MSVGAPPPDLREAVPPPLRLLFAVALLVTVPSAVAALLAAIGIGAADPRTGPLGMAGAAVAMLLFATVVSAGAGFRPLRIGATLRRWLVVELCWVPAMIGYLAAMRALGHPVPPQPELDRLAEVGIAAATWPTIATAVLVAPVLEELLCRGYLLASVRPFLPLWLAHLVTAAAFGALHGSAYALPIGLLGLGLGWIRERGGSLLPSMLAHALHNASVVLVAVVWPAAIHMLYPR